MEKNIVSKIKNIQTRKGNTVSTIKDLHPETLVRYAMEYEGNARTGEYHLEDDSLFPYHLSDAIFLHDNAYHYPHYNDDNKIKTKLHSAINNEEIIIPASVFAFLAIATSSMCADYFINGYVSSLLPSSIEWVSIITSLVFFILFFVSFILLCALASKEIGLSSLTALDKEKTHRLKNIPMVQPQQDMPEKITSIHSQFSSTMEDLLDNTPQALSNAGWDLLISAYENYTSLYVFLAEKSGIISDELMDSYSTKLEKRYNKFSSIAQDVLNTAQKYQLYLDKEKQHSTQIQQSMLDGDALRAIPLEEEKEL